MGFNNDVRSHDALQRQCVQRHGMKQSEKHLKITCLLTQITIWPTGLTPWAAQCHTLPHIFGCVLMTRAYNRFIDPKIFTTVCVVEIKSLQKLNFFLQI